MRKTTPHLRRLFRGALLLTGCWLSGCDHGLEPSPVESPMVPHTAASSVTSVAPETLSQDLLNDTARVFPERQQTVYGDPDFVDNQDPNLLVRQDGTEVFVTFISSVSAATNALAWFSYPDGQPPSSPPQLTLSNIVFSNAKATAAGTQFSLGTFSAGTRIGFVLLANGGGNPPNLSATAYSSLSTLNSGNVHFISKHHIAEQRRVIGVEDMPLATADKDYNDLIFSIRSSPPEPPPSPFHGLLDILEDRNNRVSSLSLNSGWVTVYSMALSAEANDLLRIRAQAQLNNNDITTTPPRGRIRLLVNGSQTDLGTGLDYNQNVTRPSIHSPLFADGNYVVPTRGSYTVSVQILASSSSSSGVLVVQPFGHLVIEHYRRFTSASTPGAATAYLLTGTSEDRDSTATTYGVNAPNVRTTFYSTSLSGRAGDLVRLFGQSTVQYGFREVDGKTQDAHAHGIYKSSSDTTPLSPFSTEHVPPEVFRVPLWSDTFERLPSDGTYTYEVRVHGTNGVGGDMSTSGSTGYLQALRFSPLSSTPTGGYVLTLSDAQRSTVTGETLLSNAGSKELLTRIVSVPGQAVLRSTAMIQLAHPSSFSSGIACTLRVGVRDSSGTELNASTASKYTTPLLDFVPLRTEALTTLPRAGTYTVALSALCIRQGSSPIVSVSDSRTVLLTDLYTTRQ